MIARVAFGAAVAGLMLAAAGYRKRFHSRAPHPTHYWADGISL